MLCQLCTALIDETCIFVRTDGKRGGDKIRMGSFCRLHGLFQSQANAALTAFAPFWFVFMTFCQSQKPFWFPCSGNDRNRSFQWHFLQEPPQFGEPVGKFCFRHNVGVIKIDGNRKITAQIFQHIAAARCTTGVQEQMWFCSGWNGGERLFQLPLIVGFGWGLHGALLLFGFGCLGFFRTRMILFGKLDLAAVAFYRHVVVWHLYF